MANAYANLQDFCDQRDLRTFGQLSNDANANTADTARISRLLDLNAAMVDSYLTGRWNLPPTDGNGLVPMCLKQVVVTLTAGMLFARREGLPKELEASVKEMKEFLVALAKGSIGLPGVNRINGPQLIASDQTNGTSRMDAVPFVDSAPTPTSTSGGFLPNNQNFGS